MGLLFNRTNAGFLQPVNRTVDGLISASNGLACLANSIFGAITNPTDILNSMALLGAGLINSIILSVTSILNQRINQILGSILAPVREIERVIADLTKISIDLQKLIKKATDMDNYFNGRQNCSNMAANMLNCIAQAGINQISNKIAMSVDKEVGKIANKISADSLKSAGSIRGYIDRHTKFIEKAQLQTKLLV